MEFNDVVDVVVVAALVALCSANENKNKTFTVDPNTL